MARTDLNLANGWIRETEGPVLEAVRNTSAIEAVAKRVPMSSPFLRMRSTDGADPRVVAEGALIPDASLNFGEVALEAVKYAEILPLSREDVRDSTGSFIEQYKVDWFSNFAAKYDNAALGVTAAKGTTTGTLADRPFESVYRVAQAAGNLTQSAGALKFSHLNTAIGGAEASNVFAMQRGVIIASPLVKAQLRVMTYEDGTPAYSAGQALSGQVGETLFGYKLVYSVGARTSAVQTSNPQGNPLIVVADRNALINGVLDGPMSQLSKEVDFKTDVYNLKVLAERAFGVSQAEAVHVVELTTAP